MRFALTLDVLSELELIGEVNSRSVVLVPIFREWLARNERWEWLAEAAFDPLVRSSGTSN
jgi:hypothetical protein